jgi:hypothetical protein
MVNRRMQRASFWSNRIDDAMIYSDKDAAIRKARTLRYNNPRVVAYKDARSIDKFQDSERTHKVGLDCMEDGWDGHKNSF